MKSDTLELYKKYRTFLFIISNERFNLYNLDKNSIDYDRFFYTYNYVISMHWDIKRPRKNYKSRRSEIIKKFEYGKYEISLRPHFCQDIRKLILTFIF